MRIQRIVMVLFFCAIIGNSSLTRAQNDQPPILEKSSSTQTIATHQNLNAVLWMQTAAEYAASTIQLYQIATDNLERALNDTSWTAATEQLRTDFSKLPPAIIVDIDETIIDNSPYQARLIRAGIEYDSRMWVAWCKEAKARPIPGSLEFLRMAHEKGVTIFYVTNRDSKLKEATRKNLGNAGFPFHKTVDTLLMKREKPEWSSSDKGPRRSHVARNYRIIMQFGDNIGDFLSKIHTDTAERMTLTLARNDWWGRRWFMVPNPSYGSWLESLTNFDRTLDDRQRIAKYISILNTDDQDR